MSDDLLNPEITADDIRFCADILLNGRLQQQLSLLLW